MMLQIYTSSHERTVNDIDAQRVAAICVWVWVRQPQVKVTKKYVWVCVCTSTTRPRAVPALPLHRSRPSTHFKKSVRYYLGWLSPLSESASLSALPTGLSRAAFSTAQQIEFPSWIPSPSYCPARPAPRNLRTCQPKQTHAQYSYALPFGVGVPRPASCSILGMTVHSKNAIT